MTIRGAEGERVLLELAERVERATGPDAELDMLIDCALKDIVPVYPTEGHPMTPGRGGRIEAAGTFKLLGWIDPGEVNRNFSPYGKPYPPVTASLDAAMTLVPEGFDWILGRTNNGLTIHAEVGGRGDEFMRFGNTPALALCAASLRAIAQATATPPEKGAE